MRESCSFEISDFLLHRKTWIGNVFDVLPIPPRVNSLVLSCVYLCVENRISGDDGLPC